MDALRKDPDLVPVSLIWQLLWRRAPKICLAQDPLLQWPLQHALRALQQQPLQALHAQPPLLPHQAMLLRHHR